MSQELTPKEKEFLINFSQSLYHSFRELEYYARLQQKSRKLTKSS